MGAEQALLLMIPQEVMEVFTRRGHRGHRGHRHQTSDKIPLFAFLVTQYDSDRLRSGVSKSVIKLLGMVWIYFYGNCVPRLCGRICSEFHVSSEERRSRKKTRAAIADHPHPRNSWRTVSPSSSWKR